jgi:hypothetical protein
MFNLQFSMFNEYFVPLHAQNDINILIRYIKEDEYYI